MILLPSDVLGNGKSRTAVAAGGRNSLVACPPAKSPARSATAENR